MPFCGVVWLVAYDTFLLKTAKIYLWKRWDNHHKISFANNRKTKLNIQPLSYRHFLQQTRSHTTRINQSRVQIRRQRLQIYAIKDRQSTCLWQNQGGQIVSQAIFERICFTWNTTTKTNCSTWNIYFCAIFHPFGSVSHETPILLYFCYFQWNFSILWNVGFVWICRFSPLNWTAKWLIFVQNGLRNNLSTLILP